MIAPDEGGARLAALYLYPFKSAAGIPLEAVDVDAAGLRNDRRFMLVDEDGAFMSQRTHPRMALLRTALSDDALEVSAAGFGTLSLPLHGADFDGRRSTVSVWGEDRFAVDLGSGPAAWASAFMGVPCRVVEATDPEDGRRVSERGRVRASFADAEPALVVSNATLEELNRRLDEPVPMNRFRPNLVVSGVTPHAEDAWTLVTMGDVLVRASRPCPRCALTTVDQETARKGVEPLRTLATYRRSASGEVFFGMNVGFEAAGTLRVGDRIVSRVEPGERRAL